MQIEVFKEEVQRILEADIKFDGHVTTIISSLTEDKLKNILEWIKECKAGIIRPEPCKNYRDFISFIYKSNDNRIRGILTKQKNAYFVELFLDKHKYYDRKRKYLGI
ncbi:MAG TPA: hypothetical protein VJI15_05735 [Candidatus Nanoarchaeia archaeon]|nr:hypothetical protein [Candidatus Nanoarchaeia archaeon]